MMTRPALALLAAACLVLCLSPAARAQPAAPPPAQTPPREDADFTDGELGEHLAAAARRAGARGFSGAVLAAIDGKVVAAVGVGHADLAGEVPNTPATLFEIASLTKQFTGAAAARLAADGRLSLDDPIGKSLPMAGVPESAHGITLEHLLRHTSGIPGTNSSGRGDDIGAVLPLFLQGGPQHTPGGHWEYWNQGYAIATEVIARAAGIPYTDYCKQHLFAPAGMRATCFTGDPPPEGMTVAVGRSARGEPRSALEHPYGGYGFQYRGMGGVVTSVWDLWRWDRALHADTPLTADAKAELFEPGPGDYGLGWFIRRDEKGRLVHSHGGGVRGFVCEMRRYPEQDALLVVLANRDDSPLRRVVADLEKILFGVATAPEAAPPAPPPTPSPATSRPPSPAATRTTAAAGSSSRRMARPPPPASTGPRAAAPPSPAPRSTSTPRAASSSTTAPTSSPSPSSPPTPRRPPRPPRRS